MIFKRYKCGICKDTGVVLEKEFVPRKELSPLERAELLVEGGYAYRLVEKPCVCRMFDQLLKRLCGQE